MKGGKPIRVIKRPLIVPINMPKRSVIDKATGKLTPAISNFASAIPESPTIDPTERSIPPVAIT
jgi:hypothetical protein